MILYGITIVSSAFLLFLVQPIIAKQILPWFGGSAAVWTVCVVFFQAVLLAGYAYAHALTRRTPRVQSLVHVALLAISLATLPIIASSGWKPLPDSDPGWRIVGLLTVTIGLPYFLLSSTGPLVQKWFAEDRATAARRHSVYRLFALSNVGSLVGLLIYPFVIEPYATLSAQAWTWSAAYACFAIACAACAWRVRTRTDEAASSWPAVAASATPADLDDAQATTSGAPPAIGQYLFWLACAALGSMLLLAFTNHITQNIASIPFLWILPLSLYLLSFVVVFEGRGGRGWYVRRWWQAPVLAAVVAMTWALSADRGVLNLHIALPIFFVGLFLACVFCHGELAATKPAPAYLTQFYLALSAGGAIGGLFVALVAPWLFDNYWEAPIALFGVCAIAATTLRGGVKNWLIGGTLAIVATVSILLAGGGATPLPTRAAVPNADAIWLGWTLVSLVAVIFAFATWKRWPVAIVVTTLLCTGFYGVRYYRFLSRDTLQASRNFYGALRVKEIANQQRRDLLHGVILHGDQYFAADRRHKPTTYYGPGSGIGVALRNLRPDGAPLDVAMIGLGAGTLAAWGRTGDHFRIYELNPAVVTIAQRDFAYLSESKATITIALGDARLSMERELDDGAKDGANQGVTDGAKRNANAGATVGSPAPFDIIAVDAFSSDSIPVHLITREALGVFQRHLKPDGVVAFHVSNRFLNLAPVVAQLAADAQMQAVDVIDDPKDDDYSASEWVLVTRNQAFLGRPDVAGRSTRIAPIPGLPMWTDQFNNLFKILK